MPMLQLQSVPAHHAGTMTAYLLHNSEKFFPPLNGACTVTNLVLTITAYLNRQTSTAAAYKLPYLGAALALNLATTAWALGIMVPMNKAMARHAEGLQQNNEDEKSEKELRRLQTRWQKMNYGMLHRFPLTLVECVFRADIAIYSRSRCHHDCFFRRCSAWSARGRQCSEDLRVG
jgi:hypothetical protein